MGLFQTSFIYCGILIALSYGELPRNESAHCSWQIESATSIANTATTTISANINEPHPELLADLFCLARIPSQRLNAVSLLAITFFQLGSYGNAVHYAIKCLRNNAFHRLCPSLLIESNYRMGLVSRALFYSQYADMMGSVNFFYGSSSRTQQLLRVSPEESLYQKFVDQWNPYRGDGLSNVIGVMDAEAFLASMEAEEVGGGGRRKRLQEGDDRYNLDVPETDGFTSPLLQNRARAFKKTFNAFLAVSNPSTSKDHLLNWSHNGVALPHIKIFALSSNAFQIPFAETYRGLSDALSAFGIPFKIVSYIEENDDSSLYILTHATPFSELLDRVPRYYVFWNMEKNPRVAVKVDSSSPGATIGFGFSKELGVEEIVYPVSFVANAIAVWESIASNIPKWRQRQSEPISVPLHFVPPLVPRDEVFSSCIAAEASMAAASSDRLSSSAQRDTADYGNFSSCHENALSCDECDDIARPIDILFYGDASAYRLQLLKSLRAEADRQGWRLATYLRYNLIGTEREALLEQAKIVLNLNSFHRVGGLRVSESAIRDAQSADALDALGSHLPRAETPLNVHRIRYALAKGKVVVSEGSGKSIDELYYSEAGVVFCDSVVEMFETLRFLLGNTRARRSLEIRAARFMARELSLSSDVSPDSLIASSFGHVGDGVSDISTMLQLATATDATSLHLLREVLINVRDVYGARRSSQSLDRNIIPTSVSCSLLPDDMSVDEEASLALIWAHWRAELPADNLASLYLQRGYQFPALLASVDGRNREVAADIIFADPAMLRGPRREGLDRRVLIGYLHRRFSYSGRYLAVDFSFKSNVTVELQGNPKFREAVVVDGSQDRESASDKFFMREKKTLNKTLSDSARQRLLYDLVLIDGLHEANHAIRDVMNAIDLLAPRGTIVVANAFPRFEIEAVYPQPPEAFYWSGDIWRALLALRTIPSLDISILDIDWGLAVIRKRKSKCGSPTLKEREIQHVDWQRFVSTADQFLPIFSFIELHAWLYD